MNIIIDQQAAMSGRSFIIREEGGTRVFGIDLVFDEGENFRAYVDEYTARQSHRPKMYNQDTVIYSRSVGFDLTKQRDLEYLNALALDVANTYIVDFR